MRLLLVDDSPPLRKSVSKGLREAGYAVDEAADGENALWYATTGDYDVIVLDLVLPVLDGLSVLRTLRSKEFTAHVLIISAKDAVGDRIRGLDAGADDYLVKPFAFEELLARIRALIRRKYEKKDRTIRIENLEIDTSSQRVWRGEEEIHLTRREYALLEYLAMRRGETVCRTDIWEHLYDFADNGSSNVVDVYIGYLRRKLDLPGKPSLIRTVRGRGYALGMAPLHPYHAARTALGRPWESVASSPIHAESDGHRGPHEGKRRYSARPSPGAERREFEVSGSVPSRGVSDLGVNKGGLEAENLGESCPWDQTEGGL